MRLITPWRTNKIFRVLHWYGGGDSAIFVEGGHDISKDIEETTDLDSADIVSSKVLDGDGVTGKHMVMFDVDIPMHVEPSSTPGHNHVYFDAYVDWESFTKLLDELANCGVVEPGYVGASKARGFTALRLPWVHKDGSRT